MQKSVGVLTHAGGFLLVKIDISKSYREFLIVACVGLGGTRATIPLSVCKKILKRSQARTGGKEKGSGGKGIPAPPERKLSKFSVGILLEKSSDFVQTDSREKRLRRLAASRFERVTKRKYRHPVSAEKVWTPGVCGGHLAGIVSGAAPRTEFNSGAGVLLRVFDKTIIRVSVKIGK